MQKNNVKFFEYRIYTTGNFKNFRREINAWIKRPA